MADSSQFMEPAFFQEPIRVTSGHFGQTRICVAACVLAAMAALSLARAQSQPPAGNNPLLGTVQGYVRDSNNRPMANATVFLQTATGTGTLATQPQVTHADSDGAYRFVALRAGVYTLRAEVNGYEGTTVGSVSLAQKETKEIDLALVSRKDSEPGNPGAATFQHGSWRNSNGGRAGIDPTVSRGFRSDSVAANPVPGPLWPTLRGLLNVKCWGPRQNLWVRSCLLE